MRTITNISNITDNSGTAPIVTYSNAVQTVIQERPRISTPRICRVIFVHCDGCCGWVYNFGFNDQSMQNRSSCGGCGYENNHSNCGCGNNHSNCHCGNHCNICGCGNNHSNCGCGYGCNNCNHCENW